MSPSKASKSALTSALISVLISNASASACLCVFDVDRTLTGKQGAEGMCSKNKRYRGVFDSAYGGGDLSVSELGLSLRTTFCAECYLAILSTGDVAHMLNQDSNDV